MPYYHIHVVVLGQDYYEYDQTLESIEKFSKLFNEGQRLMVGGRFLNPTDIGKLRIFRTEAVRRRCAGAVWDDGINVTRDFIDRPPSDDFAGTRPKRTIRIIWDAGLQISKGDEVVIQRGIISNENSIRASVLKNITTGREEKSRIEDVLMTKNPIDIVPPIRGLVQRIEARPNETQFDLAVGLGVFEVGLGSLLKEAAKFLDKDIVENCVYKRDAEDIVTSAFRILEERVRAKIGAGHECHGVDLVKEAFHPETGKLTFGKTPAEREGLYHLFRSSILFLRNPPSHRFIREYTEFEIFEMVCLVNLLLNILEKCQVKANSKIGEGKAMAEP